MVIGYDAKRAFRNNTGLGNYSRLLVTSLAAADDDMELLLYAPRTEGRHEHFCDHQPRVSVIRPHGLWRLAGWLWRSWGVSHRLRRDGVELYHGLSHELPLGIPQGVKRVVTMHDLIVWRHPEYFKPFDRLVHRLKQRHACRVADIVVAISEQTKRDLIDIMHVDERKIRVLYQSCDPIFWSTDLKDLKGPKDLTDLKARYALPERYILAVGTVEQRKNQEAAVRALAQLPSDVALVILGRNRGGYAERVMRVADECGVRQRVYILSGVPFADFPALYRGAVASVYLSRFEGFGIPVLESICCDTPVVTSNLSSMPEAGGEGALYADPDDIDTVASHLRRLLDDPAFRQQMVDHGWVHRQQFRPDILAHQMAVLYWDLKC